MSNFLYIIGKSAFEFLCMFVVKGLIFMIKVSRIFFAIFKAPQPENQRLLFEPPRRQIP